MPPLTAILERLEASSWATFIHDRAWAFTTVAVVHVFAAALVLGTIMIVDLRLLGRAASNRPFTDVAGSLLPLTWTAFVIAAAAGALLFMSRATAYVASPAFWSKMTLIILAGINMAVFEFVTARGVARWNTDAAPPPAARLAGALSMSCWVLVICFGRLIAFTLESD